MRRYLNVLCNIVELYHWDVLATSKEDVSRWMFHLRLVWDVVRTYWLYAVVIYFLDVVTNIFYHVIETYHELVVKCLISDVPATLLRYLWYFGFHIFDWSYSSLYIILIFISIIIDNWSNLSSESILTVNSN